MAEKKGYDAISVYDEMQGASDAQILEKAFQEARIVITSDKDFGEMIFRSQKSHGGIMLLWLSHGFFSNATKVIQAVLDNHKGEIENNFVVATEKTIRIIKLAQ